MKWISSMEASSRVMRWMLTAIVMLGISIPAHADPINGDLFYTRFATNTTSESNVRKVAFSYDGVSNFSLGTKTDIARTNGADGIIFAPNGHLLVGGQGDRVHDVNPTNGAIVTKTAGGVAAFHMALDPSGNKAWASGIPGGLAEIPLAPFSNGIAHSITGLDSVVTGIAFNSSGQAVYTTAGSGGPGNFGTINLTTFTTTRLHTGLTAAHGIAYDSFTNTFVLFGDNAITVISATTLAILGTRTFSGVDFDQGSVDGNGHLFVASNNGFLFFMDYRASGSILNMGNFFSNQFLDSFLDDVAPLSGPGSNPVPVPSGVILMGIGISCVCVVQRVRRRRMAI